MCIFVLVTIASFSLFSIILYKEFYIPFPSEKNPIKIYASSLHNLRFLAQKILKSAEHSIQLSSFTLSDESILALLAKKHLESKKVTITTDHKTLLSPHELFQKNLTWKLKKTKGLMHEKILIVDESITYLGSANMTYESLMMHDNLILGIYDKLLAKALQKEEFGEQKFQVGNQELVLYRLPYKSTAPVEHILQAIQNAKKSIQIAMFTLTHKPLIEALIHAAQKGVSVVMYIDRNSSRGASKEAIETLLNAKVPIQTNTGMQLLHHKMMLVDETVFFLGSANWTKSAFKKNQDFFLSLTPILPEQKRIIKKIFKQINRATQLIKE